MGWLDHKHYWLPATALNTIHQPGVEKATGGLVVEKCSCGAVRTIEFAPGHDPVVRYAAEKK